MITLENLDPLSRLLHHCATETSTSFAIIDLEGLAHTLARPEVADWLIAKSKATPYFNLEGYMDRDWLFNPYETYEQKLARRAQGLPEPEYLGPSGRIHHILREDDDCALHDHPWPARTFVLKGWYKEERLVDGERVEFTRQAGDTATLNFGEYHRITEVSEGGVWTLFVTEEYQGTWGFLVDGKKVPYREYLGLP